jgi:hypothetical protein
MTTPEKALETIANQIVGQMRIIGEGVTKRAGQVVPVREIPADLSGITPDDLIVAMHAEYQDRLEIFTANLQAVAAELSRLIEIQQGEFESAARCVLERLIATQQARTNP